MLKNILRVCIFALFQTVCYADSQLQSQRFFQNNGGLVDHISPFRVPNNAATAIENITMDDRGQLSKRNGYTAVQSTFALNGFSTWTVTGGSFHKAATGSDFFAVVTGSAVYRIGSSFSSYSSVTSTVSLTVSVTNLAQATQYQDKAVFCNEQDQVFYVGSSGNAFALDANMTTFSAAKTCATYGSYLVVANTTESGTSFPTRVRWSDINTINSFPSLNFIDVESNDGDKITGIVAFDESVYIFKKHSIYRMLITGLDGPDAFIIRPFSRNIGAWAKNTIKVIPNVGIAFLADHTAYLLNSNGLSPIGDPIQRTFDNVQHSQWANAVAEVYPQRYQYWLSVSTAGSANTEVLVYDYVQNNWTIYDDMNLSMLAQAEDSTGKNVLISGGYNNVTWKQDTGSVDQEYGTSTGSSTAITASYTTANLFMGSYSNTSDTYIGLPDLTKSFKYLYLYTQGDQIYTLNVQAAYDYTQNYEFNQNVQVGSAGALYDTGKYDTDIYPASGFNVARLELNRAAKAIQLKFTNNTSGQAFGLVGWSVVYAVQDYRQ